VGKKHTNSLLVQSLPSNYVDVTIGIVDLCSCSEQFNPNWQRFNEACEQGTFLTMFILKAHNHLLAINSIVIFWVQLDFDFATECSIWIIADKLRNETLCLKTFIL